MSAIRKARMMCPWPTHSQRTRYFHVIRDVCACQSKTLGECRAAREFVGCEVGHPGSKRFRRNGWLLPQGEDDETPDDEANRQKAPVCHRITIADLAAGPSPFGRGSFLLLPIR